MARNISNTRTISACHARMAHVLIASLLLLTGCTSNEFSHREPEQLGDSSQTRAHQPAGLEARAQVPDRIVVPSIDLDSSVVSVGWSGTSDPRESLPNLWDVADFAAGWHVNSDMLGQSGNVVLSGHNNIQGAVFQKLDRLEAGDVATLWSGENQYSYVIDEVVIVRERGMSMEQRRENARWIGKFDDDRLTLISCWPPNDNSHRIIVVGHAVGDLVGEARAFSTVP